MKPRSLIYLAIILLTATTTSADENGADAAEMTSWEGVSSYAFITQTDSHVLYANRSDRIWVNTTTRIHGAFDRANRSSWLSMSRTSGDYAESMEAYLIEDDRYFKIDQNWTRNVVANSARALEEDDELRVASELIEGSGPVLEGTETLEGRVCHRLRGALPRDVHLLMVESGLLQAALDAPIPLSEEISMAAKDLNGTKIMEDSRAVLSAWISRDGGLPIRVETDLSYSATPETLNISAEEGFLIQGRRKEVTIFWAYDEPANIALPEGVRAA